MTKNELEKFHTRALLTLLKQSRLACSCGCGEPENPDLSTAEIKEVLKTREHIPNKQEAKARRQAAAKKKR